MTRLPHNRRRGATTVEFAAVLPVLFLLLLGMIEFTTFYQVHGASTAAVLRGGREAAISTARRGDVERVIRDSLAMSGVSNVAIEMTPSELGPDTDSIRLRVEVPVSTSNRFILTRFVRGSFVRELEIDRL